MKLKSLHHRRGNGSKSETTTPKRQADGGQNREQKMLPEWKVVRYRHHPFRQHFCFLMQLFSSQASCYARAVRPPTSQSTIKAAVLTLKMADGFPCHPGCDTVPAQSIHMDLGVRMDGYGPPPPFILTSCGKLQEYASWSTFAGHEAYLFVIPSIGIKRNLFGFS